MTQFDPTKMAAFRGDEDSASPTTIIFKQMQAQGIPLNAGNIKAFMERIRSSPDTPGQIDKAAGGNFDYETADKGQRPAALRVERGSDDTPQPTDEARAPRGAVDTRSGDQREAANPPRDAGKDTSAQPTPQPIDVSNIGKLIATGGALGLPIAGAIGQGALQRRMPGPDAMPVPGEAAGPMPDVAPQSGVGGVPRVGGPEPQLALPPPGTPPIADPNTAIPMQGPTPLEDPMLKAIAPQIPLSSQVQTNAAPPVDANITVRPGTGVGAPANDVPMMPPLRPQAPRVPTPRGEPTMVPRIRVPRLNLG